MAYFTHAVNRLWVKICCFALIGINIHWIVYCLVHSASLNLISIVLWMLRNYVHLVSYLSWSKLETERMCFTKTLFCPTTSCAILLLIFVHARPNRLIESWTFLLFVYLKIIARCVTCTFFLFSIMLVFQRLLYQLCTNKDTTNNNRGIHQKRIAIFLKI